MRNWIDLINEAAMPHNLTGNLIGLTFGFESEFLVRNTTYAEEADLYAFDEDTIAAELAADEDKFNSELELWREDGHEDGDVHDWINDIGEAEWWNLIGATGNWEYTLKDGEIVRTPGWSSVVDYLREDIQEHLDIENIVSAYSSETPIENKDYDDWHLESDASVHGDDSDDHAFELVSPVFHSYEDFKAALTKWLAWFPTHYQGGLYTNRTTGLHINIGMPDAAATIDPLKLLLFVGEKWVTRHWRHEGNGHTDELLPLLNDKGLPLSVDAAKQITKAFILGLNEKSFAVNFLTLIERGYVEFRPIGNMGYETRLDEIIKHVNLFTQAIRIASDPSLYRREYAMKLAKLVGGPADHVTPTLTASKRLIRRWVDASNLGPGDKRKIMDADGNVNLDVRFLAMLVASESGFKKGPIPQAVLNAMIREAHITPEQYRALRTEFDERLPGWYMDEEGYAAVKARLDPILGK